jgi:hypothetical protein
MPIQFLNTNGRGGFTLRNNSALGRFSMNTYPVDVDANAFFDRVTAAGGTLSLTEQNAVNTLVLSLKANNLWTSMLVIYPMVGASAAACAQNLKSSSFTGTFNGGWTFASTGASPNGTNAYFNTGFVPASSLTQDSNHLSFYSRSNVAASSEVEIGSMTTLGSRFFHMHTFYSGNIMFSLLATSTTQSVSNNNSLGFFNGNRTSSTIVSNFKNGSNLGNVNMNSVPLNSNNVYISALDIDNVPSNYSTKQCAFASIGSGLSDTDAANFYTNVQTFQTSLSRQV